MSLVYNNIRKETYLHCNISMSVTYKTPSYNKFTLLKFSLNFVPLITVSKNCADIQTELENWLSHLLLSRSLLLKLWIMNQ